MAADSSFIEVPKLFKTRRAKPITAITAIKTSRTARILILERYSASIVFKIDKEEENTDISLKLLLVCKFLY